MSSKDDRIRLYFQQKNESDIRIGFVKCKIDCWHEADMTIKKKKKKKIIWLIIFKKKKKKKKKLFD